MTEKKIAEKPIGDMSFEEAMDALDAVVRALEGGEVPLEKSIALYERGDALKKHCEAKLGEAELKVEKITADADGGATGAEPFKTE